jgi:hypothetical protein
MDAAPQALLTPRCYTVPVEDGLLHVQLLELGQQVRAACVTRRARSVKAARLCRRRDGGSTATRRACCTLSARLLTVHAGAVCPPSPQTFVWLGHGAPSLSNLTAAAPTRFSSVPAVSNLLGSTDGASLAQRLGARALPMRRASAQSARTSLLLSF